MNEDEQPQAYTHILLGEPETVPFEDPSEYDLYGDPTEYDQAAEGPEELDDEEDYSQAFEMPGKCDACYVEFDASSTTDHCAVEGTCWEHCTNKVGHVTVFALDEKNPPQEVFGAIKKFTVKPIPQASWGAYSQAVTAKNPIPESTKQSLLALIKSAEGSVPTVPEMIALRVAGLEAVALSEHALNVQLSEGRSLTSHKDDATDGPCDTCEKLMSYRKEAMDLLKPMVEAAMQQAEVEKVTVTRAQMGLCVDCGKPPIDGRTYTLDEGKGFMCARCAGPYLIMDDGKVGEAFDDA